MALTFLASVFFSVASAEPALAALRRAAPRPATPVAETAPKIRTTTTTTSRTHTVTRPTVPTVEETAPEVREATTSTTISRARARAHTVPRSETPKEEKIIPEKHTEPTVSEESVPEKPKHQRRVREEEKTVKEEKEENPKEENVISRVETPILPALAANALLSYQASQSNRLVWGPTFETVEAVQINPAALEIMSGKTGADLTIQIAGRDYKLFQERIDYRGSNNYSWFGKVQGASVLSHFAVVDGAIAGEIWLASGKHYSVLSRGGGQYLVTWDENEISRGLANDVLEANPIVAASNALATTLSRQRPVSRPSWCTGEEIENIDQLVIYTQQAQDWFSKNATEGEKQIRAAAQNSVDATNGVTINSTGNEWQYRLNLVGTEKVNHTDAGSLVPKGWIGDDLQWAYESSEVAELRNKYNADAVMLLVGSCGREACGSATLPGNEISGHAVTATQGGAFTIAHENGHILWGMGHNPESWIGADPVWAVDHYVNGVASGVMVGAGAVCPNDCPHSPHWANPNINYLGTKTPSGVKDQRENWRMLALFSNYTSMHRVSGNENRCLTR